MKVPLRVREAAGFRVAVFVYHLPCMLGRPHPSWYFSPVPPWAACSSADGCPLAPPLAPPLPAPPPVAPPFALPLPAPPPWAACSSADGRPLAPGSEISDSEAEKILTLRDAVHLSKLQAN